MNSSNKLAGSFSPSVSNFQPSFPLPRHAVMHPSKPKDPLSFDFEGLEEGGQCCSKTEDIGEIGPSFLLHETSKHHKIQPGCYIHVPDFASHYGLLSLPLNERLECYENLAIYYKYPLREANGHS